MKNVPLLLNRGSRYWRAAIAEARKTKEGQVAFNWILICDGTHRGKFGASIDSEFFAGRITFAE